MNGKWLARTGIRYPQSNLYANLTPATRMRRWRSEAIEQTIFVLLYAVQWQADGAYTLIKARVPSQPLNPLSSFAYNASRLTIGSGYLGLGNHISPPRRADNLA